MCFSSVRGGHFVCFKSAVRRGNLSQVIKTDTMSTKRKGGAIMSNAAIDYNRIPSAEERHEPRLCRPVAIGGMPRQALNRELEKGLDSLNTGNVMTPDEMDAALAQEFRR